MKLKLYQADAFTNKIFGGNPAAVCPLEKWLPDEMMQQIANENNLAETAFFVKEGEDYGLRWFTPVYEVDLCGHATLASAFILFEILNYDKPEIKFHTRSGVLSVKKDGAFLKMNFPKDEMSKIETPAVVMEAIKQTPLETWKGKTDYMAVLSSQKVLEALQSDFGMLKTLENMRGVICTAKGERVDFVSRCFYPAYGIDEDSATGSAHTTLTPYWAEKLNKKKLTAQQLSKRKGDFVCELVGDRVEISGQAKLYLTGEIEI
ncbi:MAG: PhzF family phenazine biosynthesis protein [Bacteroidota bacterium]